MPMRDMDSRRWARLRAQVLREEDCCHLCGEMVDKTLPGTDPNGPSVDHVIPRDHGGSPYDRGNLRLAHQGCNSRKRNGLVSRRMAHARDW